MLKLTKFFVLLFSMAFFATGCIATNVHRFPTYDYAMSMGGPERPKLFYIDSVKLNAELTPYAVVIGSGGNGIEEKYIAREIWKKAAELKADVVLLKSGGAEVSGAIASAMPVGFGMTTAISAPMYRVTVYGYCMRLNPSRLGFKTDGSKMILDIFNESVREAGILEGDKIISINDFDFGTNTPEILKLKEGDEFELRVVRPGTGQLQKKAKTVKNNTAYISYSDAIPWEEERKFTSCDGSSSICN